MLILKDIVKDYVTGDTTVRAMKNISINFRENEFVAILGPSGCGKTTMLNIIGGLDRYTSGDLVINGKSTKTFTDDDWDTYRNHSIGFIFQSYNLIPHQTVVENVELALTLSGVSKKERRKRAIEALEKVGLGECLDKRPSQMSGGQMQRVAIARALINSPDILLADEPTGALDSETSIQIMELLKEIAKDKLIIMVTHNPELAYQYANRIVSCLDGEVVDDSNPFIPEQADYEYEKKKAEEEKAKGKKPSMSMITAFSLSLRNLFTKRGRTLMTAFAGSIGIIGIALVLALQTGINSYIDKIESDALLLYPMSVEKEAMNMDNVLGSLTGFSPTAEADHEKDAIYTNDSVTQMLNMFISQASANNLQSFKKYVDTNLDKFKSLCNDVQFNYSAPLNIYRADTDNGVVQVSPNTIMDSMSMGGMENMGSFVDMDSFTNLWQQLIGDNATIEEHYDIISGRLPEKYNEVVVVVDGNNEINEMMAYALGLKDQSTFATDLMDTIANKQEADTGLAEKYSYDDILSLKYKLVLSCDYMHKDDKTGLWQDMRANNLYVKNLIDNGVDINVVGIVRPDEDNVLSVGTGSIGYRADLMEYVLDKTAESQVVKEQLSNTKRDVITGLEFMDKTVNDFDLVDIDLKEIDFNYLDITPFMSMAGDMDLSQIDITDMSSMFDFGDLSDLQKKLMEGFLSDEQVLALKQAYLDTVNAQCSLENTYKTLGYTTKDNPSSIALYPKDFETKAEVNNMVDYYNESVTNDGHAELTINCTDYIGIVMSVATQAINIVSYTLIIFVAISLVVSSIMIGIITYVSVIERTKEIGILRSIGASKRDISNVFNAETIIIGFSAGFVGILVTTLLEIPINLLLKHFTGTAVGAVLPVVSGVILIAISMFLTFIAGLVPSSMAAKKDPVEALRSE
ncbi:MAG: ABC transporter ATP-binding protein/permease [Faecalibacterium sp.]|nr:ABC transporter ATP-binding protein/permease [Ruminococcus sp.]MCM1391374.1 ABC transporter ATP-binding protein/permease [Ruminococcus sp.]MCM1484584.1 ABC transporter ATP-binding protein/permease [Faecalibacterium sp.]